MLLRKCKLTLLIRNVVHAEFKCGQNIEKNTWLLLVSTLPYSSLEPFLRVLPYSFRLQVLLPRAVLEESSSQHRNKKSLKVGDGPETRQSSTAETLEQRNEKAKGERS